MITIHELFHEKKKNQPRAWKLLADRTNGYSVFRAKTNEIAALTSRIHQHYALFTRPIHSVMSCSSTLSYISTRSIYRYLAGSFFPMIHQASAVDSQHIQFKVSQKSFCDELATHELYQESKPSSKAGCWWGGRSCILSWGRQKEKGGRWRLGRGRHQTVLETSVSIKFKPKKQSWSIKVSWQGWVAASPQAVLIVGW